MLIGALARQSGISIQTIRFYERQGLLLPAHRRESGYREYDARDVRRLRFVRQAKQMGFSLKEIHEILLLREQGECPCSEVTALARAHLTSVARQIKELQLFAAKLKKAVRSWQRSGQQPVSADVFCSLIESSMAEKKNKNRA